MAAVCGTESMASCQLSVRGPASRVTSLERGSGACPRDSQSLRPLSIRELGERGVTLPWTTWGCLLCWMNHSGDCFSQTVCGPGKPPSQSEIRSKSSHLSTQLHSQPSVRVQLPFLGLHSLTPSVCHRPARAQTSGNTAVLGNPDGGHSTKQSLVLAPVPAPPCSRVSGCRPA